MADHSHNSSHDISCAPSHDAANQRQPVRLGRRDLLATGLMLFALFFGAGNLIFPPVLGASAGEHLPAVMAGFLVTGVLMPLVAVVAVSTSGEGIVGLARRVGPRFGTLMPLAVYLSIGPLYAVPRAATVAFELATRPVLRLVGVDAGGWVLGVHAVVFLALALVIALRPGRMVDSVGRWLTPALIVLLALLCVAVAVGERGEPGPVTPAYASAPLATGLTQGYLTMDVLAATVFGIVVITSLRARGLSGRGEVLRATSAAGVVAALCLAAVYAGLALVGAHSHGPGGEAGGAGLLRDAASQALGPAGVVVFAAVVVLACLTTAAGLLAAWAGYACTAWPALSLNRHLLAGGIVALAVTSLGLSAILAVVSPLTLLLYPVTICLVVATLLDVLAPGHLRSAYLWPVVVAGALGAVSALAGLGWSAPSDLLARTGAWDVATGWILPALVALGAGVVADVRSGRWSAGSGPAGDAGGVPAPQGGGNLAG